MAPFGTTYNPSQVALGGGPGPYLYTNKQPPRPPQVGQPSAGTPPAISPIVPPQAPAQSGTLAPEAIRATGSGPFSPAYRQNLATYAGGQFARPGGSMSFNPTDLSTFPGQPTGGGTAPVAGMPSSLMDMALGGQSFNWTPPPQSATENASPGMLQTLQQWLQQFLQQGSRGRMNSFV